MLVRCKYCLLSSNLLIYANIYLAFTYLLIIDIEPLSAPSYLVVFLVISGLLAFVFRFDVAQLVSANNRTSSDYISECLVESSFTDDTE